MSDTTTANERGTGGRPVIVQEFLTLDGFMVGPDEDMSWVIDAFDRTQQNDLAEEMSRDYGVFVFGRVTFDIFSAYWPHAVPYDEGDELKPADGKEDLRIIRALNDGLKVVFSTTLGASDWANTRVVSGGLEDEIRRLKHAPGPEGAISVHGSASIVQALARADLVDEYRLYIHPVLLGAGKRLFAGHDRQDFELTRLTRYDNGAMATTYQRKAAAR